MIDIHVIGAGPSGCISAISAIRNHNANVIVSEEHACAGIPMHCSGLFSIDGLESLKEFVDYKKVIINRINGAVIDIAGQKLTIDTKKSVAVVCNRTNFDRILAENAKKESAIMEYSKKVKNKFKANNIIGADGPNSIVASYFGFPRIKRFVSTLQTKIEYQCENLHIVEIFLSMSKFPGFFGWIIPHNKDEAEFGCGVLLPNNAKKAFDALLKMKGIKKAVNASGAIIPIESRVKTAIVYNGKNILLVGDAAGQTKATTGGGIVFGGNCAKLAGRYFDEPLLYELMWRRKYLPDLFLHSLIREQLSKKEDQELEKFAKKLKDAGVEEYLSKNGHMDKPTKMISFGLLGVLIRAI